MKKSFKIIFLLLIYSVVFANVPTKIQDIDIFKNKIIIKSNNLTKENFIKIQMMNDKKLVYDIKNTFFKSKYKKIFKNSEFYEYIEIFQKNIDIVRIIFYLKRSYIEINNIITEKNNEIIMKFKFKSNIEYIPVIVIDPGHGGKDPGAISGKDFEKDIAFSVAKKLSDKLNTYKKVRSFLTRTSDYFIPLKDRIKIAKEMFADMFISIHLDSLNNKKCNGFGIYYLSKNGATSAAAKRLAEKENSVDIIGGISKNDSLEIYSILMDLEQTNTIKESAKFSGILKNKLIKNKIKVHTVSQANFAVLKSFNIPSALLEIGFISNNKERHLLKTEKYQNKLVEIIGNSIYNYLVNKNIQTKRYFEITKEQAKVKKQEVFLKRNTNKNKNLKFISH